MFNELKEIYRNLLLTDIPASNFTFYIKMKRHENTALEVKCKSDTVVTLSVVYIKFSIFHGWKIEYGTRAYEYSGLESTINKIDELLLA